MDKYAIQKLRDLPIEGVAERLGLRVVRHKALCPFHDDSHPSLSFSVAKNTYKCFVCGAHGGVIDLAMQVLAKGFREACQWLADEHNVILTQWQPALKMTAPKPFDTAKYIRFFEHPQLNQAAHRFLYEERHLDERVVGWCRLTSYTDRNGISWLQIPYFNRDGKLLGVQSRNLCPASIAAGTPRFRFPTGSQCHIYNLPVLRMLREGEPLYITEGASDCWSMLSSGHKAIAIPSATLLKAADLQVLASLKTELHIYPDNDEPGERLYRQLVQLSLSLSLPLVKHALPDGCKDYSELYLQNLKISQQ